MSTTAPLSLLTPMVELVGTPCSAAESCPRTPTGDLTTIFYLERLATISQLAISPPSSISNVSPTVHSAPPPKSTISPYRIEAWKHLTIM